MELRSTERRPLYKFKIIITMSQNTPFREVIPQWNGKSESFENFVDRCNLWVLGSTEADRVLLGPRLLASFPETSPHYRLGKTLKTEELVKKIASKTC